MKLLFKISLFLNFVLLGLLIFGHTARRAAPPKVSAPGLAAPPAGADRTPPAAPNAATPPPPAAASPFRWSQLDASDYRIYVKNLRATGCPETSVRAIVIADVQAVYGQRRRQLEQQLTDLEGRPLVAQLSAYQTGQAIKTELAQIPVEASAKIQELLGLGPASVAVAPASTATGPLVLPLALQPLDLSAMQLDSQQIATINNLHERFIAQFGGTVPDPSDPVASQKWSKAQAESDDLMQGLIGNEAYQNLQQQALAKDQAATAAQ